MFLAAGVMAGATLGGRSARAEDDGTLPPAAAAALARDPGAGVAGNPDGGLDVIEFFDYRCVYCRQMDPRLAAVAARNASMRIIYKEWPVFGGVSVDAARLALAAGWQGGYAAAHAALWTVAPPMTPDGLRATLRGAGLDMARLDRDMTAHAADIDARLRRNAAEAASLSLQGTPGLVVGPYVVRGSLSAADLSDVVADASRVVALAR